MMQHKAIIAKSTTYRWIKKSLTFLTILLLTLFAGAPGKSPGPDTSITILRLCRFCSELLFIIHSKHKKQLRHAAFLFCIFHTVLLPERFADHRSAFTFGTHLWDSPEGHPVTVPSVFHGHLRVLFLRRAFACFPATFYWLDM